MSAIGINDPDSQIFIEDGGAGYNLSNRFATRGGAGSGVLLVPATGLDGTITGFSIADLQQDVHFYHQISLLKLKLRMRNMLMLVLRLELFPLTV